MATEQNFQKILIEELQTLLRPLADAAGSVDRRNDLLRQLGWDVNGVQGFPIASLNDALTSFAVGFSSLADLIEDAPEGLEGLAEAFKTTVIVTEGALSLSDAFSNSGQATPEGFGRLGKELIDYLTVSYLLEFHPVAYHLLYLLTVIDDVPTEAVVEAGVVIRAPGTRRALRLDQIPRLLSNPIETLKGEYALAGGLLTPNVTADKLFPRLLFFARQTGAAASYGVNPDDLVNFDMGTAGNEIARHTLSVFWALPDPFDTTLVRAGAGIALSSNLGVILRPIGALQETLVFGEWFTTLLVSAQSEGVAISSSGIQFPSGSTGAIQLRIEAERQPQVNEAGVPLAFQAGSTTGTRLEVNEVRVGALVELSPGTKEYGFSFFIGGARFVIANGDGDGFLKEVLPSEVPIEFDFLVGWSNLRGLYFGGAGGLEMVLPVNVSIGGVLDINSIELGIRVDGEAVDLAATATFTAHIGSVVDVVAHKTGLLTHVTFPDGDREVGNLGPLNAELTFQFPRGLGIAVHAGPVTGGGFIFLDPDIGRYSGALELSVFGIGVKAFGLIETRFPDGSEGFSFVIIIVAEFTPIQLGFGFTLLGVGGLIGMHRTVDAEALGAAARTGSLAHLLFPTNPVADAPAIIHDLATVFPPARNHFIVGPMAKFGWGTPTLITGSFGVLIEFPGPRIGLIGVVRMQLPDPAAAILSLQMAISGFMDFPAKLLSVDAGLFDSVVAGFPVWGDMAYRLGFGNNAKFLMSIGGFNPDFDAPAEFPVLRRASVELGVTGNPSLVASGYFALTSNTAQIGARIDLRASGFGIRLTGWLGFDALFVFSPFSFTASFRAGMRVSFHGAGIGVTLHGTLKGTNPWKITGKVCVSVLFWDACLSVDHTFGNRDAAALPEIDPWEGLQSDDPRLQVVGMRAAVSDARNWSGTNPPAGFSVVTLSEATTAGRTPIDPLGAATLRQRVAPLGEVLTKFGEYKPIINNEFTVESVKFDEQEVTSRVDVEDDFAPAHFFELSNAERLSTESYQKMRAGFTIDPERTTVGSADSTTVDYETDFITVDGNFVHDDVVYRPSQALISGLLKNLAKLKGVRQTGARKFITPNKAKKVTFGPARYVVVDSCTSVPNTAILGTETTQIAALLALRKHVGANPTDFNRYQVAPKFAVPMTMP